MPLGEMPGHPTHRVRCLDTRHTGSDAQCNWKNEDNSFTGITEELASGHPILQTNKQIN